jgi:hypothetical protein
MIQVTLVSVGDSSVVELISGIRPKPYRLVEVLDRSVVFPFESISDAPIVVRDCKSIEHLAPHLNYGRATLDGKIRRTESGSKQRVHSCGV